MMSVDVVVRGKWKPVELEPSLFLQKDFSHLICIEELTDYDIVGRNNTEVVSKVCFRIIAHPRPQWYTNDV